MIFLIYKNTYDIYFINQSIDDLSNANEKKGRHNGKDRDYNFRHNT